MKYTMERRNSTITLDTATGNITGDTYQMQDVIKEEFPGATWNKAAKAWTVNNLAERIEEIRSYLTRCYRLSEVKADESPVTVRDAVINRINGLCPRCHTYCYGDCSFR